MRAVVTDCAGFMGSGLFFPYPPYGVNKLAAKSSGQLYRESPQVRTLSFRHFSVYGLRQRPGVAVHGLVETVQKDEETETFCDGSCHEEECEKPASSVN